MKRFAALLLRLLGLPATAVIFTLLALGSFVTIPASAVELEFQQRLAEGSPYGSGIFSPDGRHYYSFGTPRRSGVAVLRRDATTGVLALERNYWNGFDGFAWPSFPADAAFSPDGGFLYVLGDGKLYVLGRTPSGRLTLVQETTTLGGVALGSPESLALSADGRRLYLGDSGGTRILVLNRDETFGMLTLRQQLRADPLLFQQALPLALAPDGRHLYAGNFRAFRLVTIFEVLGNGELRAVADAEIDPGNGSPARNLNRLVLSPEGGHLYSVSRSDATLTLFRRNAASGGLTRIGIQTRQSPQAQPNIADFAISPDGTFAYMIGPRVLEVLRRDSGTGVLSLDSDFLRPGPDLFGTFTLAPDGGQLYLDEVRTVGGSEQLAWLQRSGGSHDFEFQPAGGLQTVWGLRDVHGIAVTADHLYTADLSGGAAAAFEVESSGGLRQVQAVTGGFATLASSVVASPDGRFLYLGARQQLSVLRRDPTTGRFEFLEGHRDGVGGVGGIQQLQQVALSPDGKFLYTLSDLEDTIAIFARDSVNGRLRFLSAFDGSESGLGQGLINATQMVISPDGRHVYVGNAGPSGIAMLRRDAATGALTTLGFLPAHEPQQLLISPDGRQVYVGAFDRLLVLARDAESGLLQETMALDSASWLVAISPDGLLVVACRNPQAGGMLVLFRRDPQSGALEEAASLSSDLLTAPRGRFSVAGDRLYLAAREGIATFFVNEFPAAGCVADETTLCLGDDRYSLRSEWRTPAGTTGFGHARDLTRDTGYFWFFQDTNVELVTKVLDGTAVNGHRWVFYGSLTNVLFTLTVTDHATGQTRHYFNPQGRFASRGDTRAFPPAAAPLTAPWRAASIGLGLPESILRIAEEQGTTAPCRPGTLCLADDRFELSVSWTDFQGGSGSGVPVDVTADTGYFWFFQDTNVELMIKVLDGTTINGHFWVFYGALSNVGYAITVRDTMTGQQRTYENPSGNFGSVGDTRAFDVR